MGRMLVNRITICLLLILNLVLSEQVACTNGQCVKLSKCQYAIDKIDDGDADELTRCDASGDDEPSYCCPQITSNLCGFAPSSGNSYEIANQYCHKIASMFEKRLLMQNGEETVINECQLKDVPVIINGEVTKIGEFPHMALLGYVNKNSPTVISWQCGGTLISDRFVLTAKHCYSQNPDAQLPDENGIIDENSDSEEDDSFEYGPVSKVRLGVHDYNSIDESNLLDLYEVAKFMAYDQELGSGYNDIALIELDRTVQCRQHIYPACLNTVNSYNLINYIITGWGEYRQYHGPSSIMLKGVVELYDDMVCVQKYKKVRRGYLDKGANPEIHICGGTKSLSNVTQSYNYCQGDSGGPLQYYNGNCSYTIIGVVSTATSKCNVIGFPSIYTRVYSYIDWIVNKIWKN